MQTLLSFLLFVVFTTNSFSQKKLSDVDSIIKNYRPIYGNKEKMMLYQAEAPKDAQLPAISLDTDNFSYRTELGEVYTLPGENMPVLRPFNTELSWGFKTTVPPQFKIPKTITASKIPNMYEEKSLYFQKTQPIPDDKRAMEY
jgi:hypothetical protein